jgi:hypothetical protein
MLKNPTSMKEIHRRQNFRVISCQFSTASLIDVSAVNFKTALVDESGTIRSQIGTHNKSVMVAVYGTPARNPNSYSDVI